MRLQGILAQSAGTGSYSPSAVERVRLSLLTCAHVVICCLSLICVADRRFFAFDPATFHIFYDPARWYVAVATVAPFALVSPVFVFASFSFGYFVAFYFYTMVLGYLWLNCFTDLIYDHRLAALSAAASAFAFLLPALFVVSPIRQTFVLSAATFDRLLTSILLLSVTTIAVGASYHFRFVAVENIYDFQDKIELPTIVRYLVGATSGALLPFAFAGFTARGAYWRAGAVLVLLLLFYPIMLSKMTLITPFWLFALWLLSKLFTARSVVMLSLLVPILSGLVWIGLLGETKGLYFSTINFRMIAIPSVAIDIYNSFFSNHDLTYFCQLSFLKPMMHCPYQDQLGGVMRSAYMLGNFNGSLFVTEGIASVGGMFAPVTVFMCGLVIALGNRLSAGLPFGFVLISAAVLPQLLLNVPLTTVLLTHGAALLFLLWYLTPRTIFEAETGGQVAN